MKTMKIQHSVFNTQTEKDLFSTLPEELYDKVIIAGGSCLSAAQKAYGQFNTSSNDIDLFVTTEEDFILICNWIQTSSNIEEKNTTALARTFSLFEKALSPANRNDLDIGVFGVTPVDIVSIQVIRPVFDSFTKIIDSFDLNNSKFWSVYPFDEIQTNQSLEMLHVLSVAHPKWNYHILKRMLKYVHNKQLKLPVDSFHITQSLKMYTTPSEDYYSHFGDSGMKTAKLTPSVQKNQRIILLDFLEESIRQNTPLDKNLRQSMENNQIIPIGDIFEHGVLSDNIHSSVELFNFWMQKNHFESTVPTYDIGWRLNSKKFYQENRKVVGKHFPELLL